MNALNYGACSCIYVSERVSAALCLSFYLCSVLRVVVICNEPPYWKGSQKLMKKNTMIYSFVNQICTFVVVVLPKWVRFLWKPFRPYFFCKLVGLIARYNEIRTLAHILFDCFLYVQNLNPPFMRTIQVKLDRIIPRQKSINKRELANVLFLCSQANQHSLFLRFYSLEKNWQTKTCTFEMTINLSICWTACCCLRCSLVKSTKPQHFQNHYYAFDSIFLELLLCFLLSPNNA